MFRAPQRFSMLVMGPTTELKIDICVTTRQPPSGEVSADDGPHMAFTGWLQLLKILSDLLADATE